MNRKKFIQTAAIVAPILYSAKVSAQETKPTSSTKTGGKYGALIDSASDCIKKGELCISHCVDMMAGGVVIVGRVDAVAERLAGLTVGVWACGVGMLRRG